MPMEQRDAEIPLQGRDLTADGRLAHTKHVARMREAAGLGGGVENSELVPIHRQLIRRGRAVCRPAQPCAAAKRLPLATVRLLLPTDDALRRGTAALFLLRSRRARMWPSTPVP